MSRAPNLAAMPRTRLLLATSALVATAFVVLAVARSPARSALTSGHDHTGHPHTVATQPADPPASDFRGLAPIEAAFRFESYRPGEVAELNVWTRSEAPASLQIFLIGRERVRAVSPDEMRGTAVSSERTVAPLRAGLRIHVRVGDWPSGLYFAQLTAPGQVGFAPFVVAPSRLGDSRVAVVLPTRTWQAQNERDDDGDGTGDSFETPERDEVRLGRPFLNRGAPPRFRASAVGFVQWLHGTGRGADVLAQEDLDETTGRELAAAYDLLVFPGSHEYVTQEEYDAVSDFRDRGGNLMLLASGNLRWRVEVHDGVLTRIAPWEAPGWAAGAKPVPQWLLPNAARRSGIAAQMTYRELPMGAKVFSAGTVALGASMRQLPVRMLLTEVWERLARTVESPSGLRPMTPAQNRVPAPPSALRGLAHLLPQYPALELASEVERAEAVRLLAEMRRAARPWTNPREAARDGFDIRRPKRRPGEDRVMWFHSEQRKNRRDDAYFDPRRPDTLIFADMPGYPLSLVGFMFSMPRGLEAGSPGGPITRWHWHVVCANPKRRGTKPRADGSCPPGTRLYGGSEMLHVWFTRDLKSAYAIHAPVPDLCAAKLVPPEGCKRGRHQHGM